MADNPPTVYLHGDLDLRIIEARRLPNMDLAAEHVRRFFSACDSCRVPSSSRKDESGTTETTHHRHIITSDPYVTVCVPGATIGRTRVISNSENPKWNEHLNLPLAHPVANLEFLVKDNDLFGAQIIGSVRFSAERISSGEHISGWFTIVGVNGKPLRKNSALYLEMKFTPCVQNPLYFYGIGGDHENLGVRHTYFPVRRGGSVTLYQDAHVVEGLLPHIELEGGAVFNQQPCWEDICHAIVEAHHLIYIVGWSVFDKVKLIREPTRPLPRCGDMTLGELLKYKSQEGVRVLLLVWDDKTSHNRLFINTG